MTFWNQHRFALLIIGLVMVYWVAAEIRYTAPEVYPNPILGDFAAYATVLVQSEAPEHFEKDLLYGSGAQSQIRRGNTLAYLWVLEGLDKLAGGDLVVAGRWYSLLLRVIYLVGMYGWLYTLSQDQFIAVVISLVSLKLSNLMASGNSWGFMAESVVPFNLFTALSPYYLLWASTRWFTQPKGIEILAGGIVAGLGLNFVHSVSGVALVQLMGGLAVLLWLSRQVKFWTIPLFSLGVLLTLPLYLPNRPDAYELSFPAAQELVGFGQQYSMIFPWRLRSLTAIGWEDDVRPFYEYFLLAYTVLSVATYLSGRKIGYLLFVTLQAIFFSLFANVGALPLLLLGISGVQIWRGAWVGWQKYAWMGSGFALWLGVFPQMLLAWLWLRNFDTNLVSYLFEWARMSHFFYLLFYALVALNFVAVLRPLQAFFQRALLILGLGVGVWFNLNLVPYPLNEGADFSLILVLLIFLAVFWKNDLQAPFSNQRQLLVGGFILGAGGITWLWLNSLGLKSLPVILLVMVWAGIIALYAASLKQARVWFRFVGITLLVFWVMGDLSVQNQNGYYFTLREALATPERQILEPRPLPYQITPDYWEMVAWVKAETPPNSLLHMSDFDRSVRYFGERALLSASQDWVLASFTGPDPKFLRDLENELKRSQSDPKIFFPLLQGYGVDYLILRKDSVQWQTPYPEPIQFENETYSIYKLADLGESAKTESGLD